MNKLILAAGITFLIFFATFFLLSTKKTKEKNIVDYQMSQKGSSIPFSPLQQTETSKENKNVSLQAKKTITAVTFANANNSKEKIGLPQNKMATNNGQQITNK